jgi:hypothetical protein
MRLPAKVHLRGFLAAACAAWLAFHAVAVAHGAEDPAGKPLEMTGKLSGADPPDRVVNVRKAFSRVHPFPMKSGKTYSIELSSREFHPFLRLEDPEGRNVVQSVAPLFAADAGRNGKSTSLVYQAPADGTYRIIVTSLNDGERGSYTLKAAEAGETALLADRVRTLITQAPADQAKTVDDLKKYLTARGKKLTAADVGLAVQAVNTLELVARDRAPAVAADLARMASAATEPGAAVQAKLLADTAQRLQRGGQPFATGPVRPGARLLLPPAGAPATPNLMPRALPPPAGGLSAPDLSTRLQTILIAAAVFAIVIAPFAAILAFQAHRRGFNFVVWMLAGLLAVNPLFPLVLLGILPSRARRTQRAAALNELERCLRDKQSARPPSSPGPVVREAERIADVPPSTIAEMPQRSVGDEVTRF